MEEIPPEKFETYRDLIQSGQIEPEQLAKLLADNPEFAEWLRGVD